MNIPGSSKYAQFCVKELSAEGKPKVELRKLLYVCMICNIKEDAEDRPMPIYCG